MLGFIFGSPYFWKLPTGIVKSKTLLVWATGLRRLPLQVHVSGPGTSAGETPWHDGYVGSSRAWGLELWVCEGASITTHIFMTIAMIAIRV